MSRKVITILLVLIVFGGLAWFINENYIFKDQVKIIGTPGSSSNLANNLVYTVSSSAHELWQLNSSLKAEKLFTDADEQEKIVKFSNIAYQSREVLAVTASNKLVSIKLDAAKINVLENTFSKPDILQVSPSGEKVAYIRFSNADDNYGYTLYSQGRIGDNKFALTTSPTEIKSPSWNNTGTQIAYTTTSGSTSQIVIVDATSKAKKTLGQFENQVIDSLAWSADKIYFSIRAVGANSGQIFKINASNTSGENKSFITDFDGGVANFLCVSKEKMAYLVAQYSAAVNDSTAGQIYILDFNGQKNAVKKGIQILGWL